MSDSIPANVREAILAEIRADSPQYRDTIPPAEPAKAHRVRSATLNLRIPSEVLARLQELAEASHLSVSSLVRGFIAEGMSTYQPEELPDILERIERDIAEVKARALAG